MSNHLLDSPIEYLKGVGPLRGELLRKELGIFTFRDLLEHFPLRHIDKTKVSSIAAITPQTDNIQVAGVIENVQLLGEKRGKRLVAELRDNTGVLELVWFQSLYWIQRSLEKNTRYLVYGKVTFFNGKAQITHPEYEKASEINTSGKNFLEPVYSTTEKLKAKGLHARQIGKLTENLLQLVSEKDIIENIPQDVLQQQHLDKRIEAYKRIHMPATVEEYQQALHRLKFEELFIAQVRLNISKIERHRFSKGVVFEKVGEQFNLFYNHYLPFNLTGAQKRVLREIRQDTASGKQMNRLLQGDVGSGKTMVALLTMLLATDNNFQSCLMAPTEILAQQHYEDLKRLLAETNVSVSLLTGSVKQKERKEILEALAVGHINILIGTHAVTEDAVKFYNLGLVIVDEQHRFGVEQRSKLWKKAVIAPHVLVMTATPIPRTLAMTTYGDLDYSVIDELPPGRKPVTTVQRNEMQRARVMDFIKTEIQQGRQAYIIYPLIEESEKMNYEDLMQGIEQVKSFFPEPAYRISVVHGRQKPEEKNVNMERFVKGITNIMVSTTVIEVGVNVPNASVMVIESAEKFGLSQLHQLRGRVGRGAEKSFCILLTGTNISRAAKERIKMMTLTNDGFKVAEKDLELRGPGEIEGTRQSGALNFKLVSLSEDKELVMLTKKLAENILAVDPELIHDDNKMLKEFIFLKEGKTAWSKIS